MPTSGRLPWARRQRAQRDRRDGLGTRCREPRERRAAALREGSANRRSPRSSAARRPRRSCSTLDPRRGHHPCRREPDVMPQKVDGLLTPRHPPGCSSARWSGNRSPPSEPTREEGTTRMDPSGTEGSGERDQWRRHGDPGLGCAAGKPVRKDEIVLEERGLFIESWLPERRSRRRPHYYLHGEADGLVAVGAISAFLRPARLGGPRAQPACALLVGDGAAGGARPRDLRRRCGRRLRGPGPDRGHRRTRDGRTAGAAPRSSGAPSTRSSLSVPRCLRPFARSRRPTSCHACRAVPGRSSSSGPGPTSRSSARTLDLDDRGRATHPAHARRRERQRAPPDARRGRRSRAIGSRTCPSSSSGPAWTGCSPRSRAPASPIGSGRNTSRWGALPLRSSNATSSVAPALTTATPGAACTGRRLRLSGPGGCRRTHGCRRPRSPRGSTPAAAGSTR